MLDAFGPREAMDWAEASGPDRFSPAARAGLSRGDEGLPAAACMAAADRGGAAAGLALGRMGRGGVGVRHAEGPALLRPRVTVLALGGASWRRLGSDGAWAAFGGKGRGPGPVPARQHGVRGGLDAPYGAASGPAAEIVRLIAGDQGVRGEAVISERGIEGGGVYAVSAAVRDGAPLPSTSCRIGAWRISPRACGSVPGNARS
jgi:hypothetical protein